MTAAPITTPEPAVAVPALAVPCPEEQGGCGADAGARCTSPSGRVARPHVARLQAALAAQAVPQPAPPAGPHPGAIAVDAAGNAEAVPTATPEPEPAGPTVEELVVRLLVLKVLAARVAEADGDSRAEVHGRLDVGVSLPGYLTDADRAAARRGERDRSLGKVGLSRPSESWRVTDVDALTAWVLEHAPDEVEHKPVVRASFLAALTAACKKDGGWVDPETSELLVPDGMELKLGTPTLQVRPSADAGDLVAEALASGLLHPDGTLALPAGD